MFDEHYIGLLNGCVLERISPRELFLYLIDGSFNLNCLKLLLDMVKINVTDTRFILRMIFIPSCDFVCRLFLPVELYIILKDFFWTGLGVVEIDNAYCLSSANSKE